MANPVRGEVRALLEVNHYPSQRAETMALCERRQYQRVQSLSCRLATLANALFCLSIPCCSCCCSCVEIKWNTDVIVKRFGIVTDILRTPTPPVQPGVTPSPVVQSLNPCCMDTEEVYVGSWLKTFTDLRVNDRNSYPLYLTAKYNYQVDDCLAATYYTNDYHTFMHEQAKSALLKVVSKYPYMPSQARERCLQRNLYEIGVEVRMLLQEYAKPVGVRVTSFVISTIRVDENMQKLLLAKQEAESYIRGRKQIAEGAVGIAAETLEHLKRNGVQLTQVETAALVADLTKIICQPEDMSLQFFKSPQPTLAVMELP